ncbi:MAG TPA: flagellar basal body P-ring formation chaperone FlgA [Caulobacteraceae bacterium]|nr:flagellar basal body P-ring formation chaperone FlgA [Caulobacteraceae bacterium]
MIRKAIIAVVLLAASPALAGQPVSLKTDAFASGAVTLGDVFDGAGRAGAVVVGPAAQPGANVILDAGQLQRQARAAGLEWDNAQGLQRIVVHGGGPAPAPAALAGRPGALRQALTYARNLSAGEIVRPDDLIWGEVADFSVPGDAPRDADAAIGKAAKKPLRAGAAVSARDLAMPQVIKKDDVVQVSFRTGGISLTLQGKAMEAATLGEPFSVMNIASKKVIEAVATGPGRAVVGPEADRIRDEQTPSLLSLR